MKPQSPMAPRTLTMRVGFLRACIMDAAAGNPFRTAAATAISGCCSPRPRVLRGQLRPRRGVWAPPPGADLVPACRYVFVFAGVQGDTSLVQVGDRSPPSHLDLPSCRGGDAALGGGQCRFRCDVRCWSRGRPAQAVWRMSRWRRATASNTPPPMIRAVATAAGPTPGTPVTGRCRRRRPAPGSRWRWVARRSTRRRSRSGKPR